MNFMNGSKIKTITTNEKIIRGKRRELISFYCNECLSNTFNSSCDCCVAKKQATEFLINLVDKGD